MKHLFTMLLTLVAATASAQDFMVDGIYYNILSEDDRTVEVISGADEYKGDIVPEEVIYDSKVYLVTTIGDNAFNRCWNLTSVSMPSVTTIGDYAFFFCYALTSVSMPSVTTIGDGAFYSCDGLTSVSMPSVTTIGDRAFYSCDALTSVDIPASCTSIAGNPFQGCQSLEEIVVDENNPNYSSMDGVLYDKDKTTLIGWPTAEGEIDIMPSVTTIGDNAFSDCFALTSVSMPSVTTIGDGAFNGCSALTSIDIPASVTTLGNSAFGDCNGLTSVYCHWVEPLECGSLVY